MNKLNVEGKKGFTLIEIIIVITIISILASVILANTDRARVSARLNGAKSSVRSALPVVISCNDSGGTVVIPIGQESGNKAICNPATSFSDAYWSKLPEGYAYVAGGNYTADCVFQISINGDGSNLTCRCDTQVCS